MRLTRRTIVFVTGLAVMFPGSAGAGSTSEVVVSDNEFTPERAHMVNPGAQYGTLRWTGSLTPTINQHNVREVHGIFSSGAPEIWSQETDFTRIFSSGRFDYLCQIHGASMSGVVAVEMGQALSSDQLPLLIWASADTNTGRVFDVQFKVDDGSWRWWKRDTERFRGAFGRNDRPAPWNPTREYRFRARSQKNANADGAHSRWSPVEFWD